MKLCGMLSVVALVLSGITSYSQNPEAEVPGDNFSLEGALELFKKSESPEHFEKLLNSPDSKVNNLDLNGDGYIDYIRVFDRYEGNVHAFILQAVVSENESQDVAVIELEKLANGKAVLQIVGDEDIYGVETIIEPTREVRTYAGARTSPTVVNVWAWPSVQYVYGPYYSGWYSPWGWRVYPVWWRSWAPVAYVHYYPIYVRYRPYYTYCDSRRIVYAHHIYRPYRTRSVVVYNRHRDQITHYRTSNRDSYRNGYVRNDRSRNNSQSRNVVERNDQSRRQHDIINRSPSTNRSELRSTGKSEEFRKPVEVSRDRQVNRSLSNERSARTPDRVGRATTERNAPVNVRSTPTEVRKTPPAQRTQDFRNENKARRNEASSRPANERRAIEAPARTEYSTPRSVPARSPNVQRSQERPQMSRPATVERRSPSASPNAQRSAPGGNAAGRERRGR